MDERICFVFKNNVLFLFYKNFINLTYIDIKPNSSEVLSKKRKKERKNNLINLKRQTTEMINDYQFQFLKGT